MVSGTLHLRTHWAPALLSQRESRLFLYPERESAELSQSNVDNVVFSGRLHRPSRRSAISRPDLAVITNWHRSRHTLVSTLVLLLNLDQREQNIALLILSAVLDTLDPFRDDLSSPKAANKPLSVAISASYLSPEEKDEGRTFASGQRRLRRLLRHRPPPRDSRATWLTTTIVPTTAAAATGALGSYTRRTT